MTEQSTAVSSSTSERLSAYGAACAASGVLGALVGIVTLVWPHDVPEDRWSYPFPMGVFWVVCLVLVVAHLLSAAGFVGVLAADPHRGQRAAGITLWIAVVGFVLLGVAEFLSGTIGREDIDSSAAGWVGTLFGVSSLMTALGGLVAGVVIIRKRVWTGLGAWMVLASGVTMLVLVTPANISGDTVPRTLALVLWSLTFIPLGRTIARSTSALPG
jgi:hypothetical protein